MFEGEKFQYQTKIKWYHMLQGTQQYCLKVRLNEFERVRKYHQGDCLGSRLQEFHQNPYNQLH
jgi:hypothetical protein